MRSMPTSWRFVLLLGLAWLGLTASVSAQSIEQSTPALVNAIAEQLVAKNKSKVAALDFTDLHGRPSELGRFLAEQLSVELVMAKGITVVDRANLNAIMAEHKLTAEGLVNPENAKKLGMFAGVDAILVGNLTTMDEQVMLTLRAVATETAEVVAAGRMKFDLTDDVRRMLGLSVATSGASTSLAGVPASSRGMGSTAEAVAGPIRAIVRNISYGFDGEGDARQPQIRVNMDFENPSLNGFAAVSINSLVVPNDNFPSAPTVGWRVGILQDSSGTKWYLANLRGVPVVYCFETIGSNIDKPKALTQSSPSNVVDYIKRGVEYSGEVLESRTQRLWSGAFASIEPGGKLEVIAIFVKPQTSQSRTRNNAFMGIGSARPTKAPTDPNFSWPENFELSVELVVGTHQDGESPEKARDLALKNVIISGLALPK